MTIHEKLILIQCELKAPKTQYNKFGNYHYRNNEDILEAVKPLLRKYQVCLTISDQVLNIGERYYIEATSKITDLETGQVVSVTASAREDVDKKGMDLSQLTGSTSSYARKYSLNGLFLIDDTKDSDYTNGTNTAPTEKPTPKPIVEPKKIEIIPTTQEKIREQEILKTFDGKVSYDLAQTDESLCTGCKSKITNPQVIKFSKDKFGKVLCFNCQKTNGKVQNV